MTTIPIEVSTEQLIRAVQQLPPHELESFVAQIVALRTQRAASSLSKQETSLLIQINMQANPGLQQRFNELMGKRQAETITPDELNELIQITDIFEKQDTERLSALIALAQLRQSTLPNLMTSLGLRPPSHV